MKNALFSLLAIACVAAAICIVLSTKSPDPFNQAVKDENAERFPQALSNYLAAFIQATDVHPIPSKTQAIATKPDVWKQQLDDYLSWLLSAKSAPSSVFQTAMQAVERCNGKVGHVNDVYDLSISRATLDEYRRLWKSIFFPDGMELPENQQALIQKAVDNAVSVVRLTGNANYRYEGGFIQCSTGKRVDFKIYTDGQTLVLLAPGAYYMTLTGTAEFSSGKMWVSPIEVLQIVVPDSASIISAKVKTDLKRRG